MKNYTLEIKAGHAQIVEMPTAFLYFSQHDFKTVWNKTTGRHDVVRGVNTFYGGMGEGSSFDRWQDALHASLYDLYQTHSDIHDGSTFTATYMGETQVYRCDGVHVVKAAVQS